MVYTTNNFLNSLQFTFPRMFKFLKKLFSGSEEGEAEKEEIRLEELGRWFKGKADKIFSDLDVRVNEIKGKVKEEITKTKDSLAILSTAKLHNPKITVRETQFMEGNRRAYILAVNNFLRGIELGKGDYSSLLGFCDDFNIRLDKFGKSTVRPYHILQEFFANESRDIAINIKNIGSLICELDKTIRNANLDKINGVRGMVAELISKIKQKEELENTARGKKETKEGLVRNRHEIEKEIEKLTKSKEYAQLNDLKANKEDVLAGIREHNARIAHAFSVMERPLRKLERMVLQDGELLGNYIENPVEALVNDNELKILGLLGKLEKNINNYTLDLKDKKREKVLETVKGLTEDFLREFVNKHNELNKKLEDLEQKISGNEALKSENKLNYELSNIQDNLEKVNGEILGNEQELSKIDVDGMKKRVGEEIHGLLNIDIDIK